MVLKTPKRQQQELDLNGTSEEVEYVVEPGDVTFDAKPEELFRRLRRIYDNARSTVEERGVTMLFLTFGFLKWDDPSLGDSVSPLWLVPCQFENFGPSAPLRLSQADEELQLNPALEVYLREHQKVNLPPLPDEVTSSALAPFLRKVLARVREQGWSVEGGTSGRYTDLVVCLCHRDNRISWFFDMWTYVAYNVDKWLHPTDRQRKSGRRLRAPSFKRSGRASNGRGWSASKKITDSKMNVWHASLVSAIAP